MRASTKTEALTAQTVSPFIYESDIFLQLEKTQLKELEQKHTALCPAVNVAMTLLSVIGSRDKPHYNNNVWIKSWFEIE